MFYHYYSVAVITFFAFCPLNTLFPSYNLSLKEYFISLFLSSKSIFFTNENINEIFKRKPLILSYSSTAIYEAAVNWKYSDGTSLRGEVNLLDGKIVSAEVPQSAVNDEVYYIVPDKCTECKGFHEEPQCAAVCPVDCCIPDLNNIESESLLLEKQKLMHSDEINA